MTIAICEDEFHFAAHLNDIVHQYLQQKELSATVLLYSSGEEFLRSNSSPLTAMTNSMQIWKKPSCRQGGSFTSQTTAALKYPVAHEIHRHPQWCLHFTDVEPDSVSGSSTTDQDMKQLRSSLQEWGMADWFPAWHPDGFIPGNLEVIDLDIGLAAYVTFYGEDSAYSVDINHFTQPTEDTGTFEKDSTPVEKYDHNGQTFYILSYIDTLAATTYNRESMITIYGTLTRE